MAQTGMIHQPKNIMFIIKHYGGPLCCGNVLVLFFSGKACKVVSTYRKMDGSKYWTALGENLLEGGKT